MSQQNLEEEAGQKDCRKMKQQAKWTADKAAGNGQGTGLQENFFEILLCRRTHR
jgi:hypothetical protein